MPPSRFLLSPPAAAAVAGLVADHGGVSIEPRRIVSPQAGAPLGLFACRVVDVGGTAHVACYCPAGASAVAVTFGAFYSWPLNSQRLASDPAWIDLGAVPSSSGRGVYLGFEDRGVAAQPRFGWRLSVSDGTYSGVPAETIEYFPYIPIAGVAPDGKVTQYRTGAIALADTWFYPISSQQWIGLHLKGTNGSTVATFNDTDSSFGISAEFPGRVRAAGEITADGNLTVPYGATANLDGTIKIGGDVYKPASIVDGRGNTITVLKKQ